MGVYLVQ